MNNKNGLISVSLIAFSLLIGCGESKIKNSDSLDVEISNKKESELKIEENIEIEPIKYKGYIGTYAVTAELDFDYSKSTIVGSYYYDKYEKSISLVGYIDTPEGTWSDYFIFEIDLKGDTTAAWSLNDTGIDYEINGIWRTPKEKQLEFRLITELKGGYLEPNSLIHFESEKKSTSFFKTHHFLHNETTNKNGLIIAEGYSKQYDAPLPVGLPIYEYGVNEGYDIGLIGVIVEGGLIKIKNNEAVLLKDECDLVMISTVGYEEVAYGFSEVRDDSLIILPTKNLKEVCIKIIDLEKYGYHLEGDGYWLKSHSGDVMGYFPAYVSNDKKDEYYHPKIQIFEDPSVESKELIVIEFEKQNGFFEVEDVQVVNGIAWVKITFDFYTEEPCEGLTFEDQPSIEGWIKLYSNELNSEVVLGFYSMGC